VQIAVSPLQDEHDKIVGVSSIARDITQRKRDEAEVRRSLRMRDQFMAMLSHELRNPLAALLHASTVLKEHHDKPEAGPRALAIVERQCKHMARLLDDLLDVSRMRQVGVELRRQRVDLRATVEAAVERVRPLAESREITIDVELPSEEVAVFGDPDRLEQVEVNLLTNAIKYSPANTRVSLSLEKDGAKGVLRVQDEGSGIACDMLERIFEPFVRAVEEDSRVHQPQMGGMGLGLAVVRSFVRAHGGDVRAISDGIGKGCEFVVSLPLAAAVEAVQSSAKQAFGSQRLVLVEDQEDSRTLLQTILEGAGYQARRGCSTPILTPLVMNSTERTSALKRHRAKPGKTRAGSGRLAIGAILQRTGRCPSSTFRCATLVAGADSRGR
jgi:two-component system CheB/CheR fusion protein